jgi:hypothetical protein
VLRAYEEKSQEGKQIEKFTNRLKIKSNDGKRVI